MFKRIAFRLTRLAHHQRFHSGHHIVLAVVATCDVVAHGLTFHGLAVSAVVVCEAVSSFAGEG